MAKRKKPSATAPQSSTVAAKDLLEMISARNKSYQDTLPGKRLFTAEDREESKRQRGEKKKAYEASPKGIKKRKAYKASPKGIKKRKAYNASPKGIKVKKVYNASPKGIAKALEYREDPVNKARRKEKSYCNIHNCQKRFCTDCMTPQDAIDKGLVCFICRVNKTRHAICDECRGICRENEPLRIEAIVG